MEDIEKKLVKQQLCWNENNMGVSSDGMAGRMRVKDRNGPCAPSNLQTSLQCSTNSTSVTWDRGSGALSYMVVGEATNSHITSCNSSATYCDLEGLQCGQMYNVSVHSMDGVCRSIQSVSSDVQTAPCPPQNVAAQVYCASGIMLVTWEPNMDARFFLVNAVTEGGSSHSCNTTDTQCSITSLPCGESFSVQVTAARGGCHSMPSQALNVSSAPCMPTGVKGSQNCVTNSAWVSWAPALGVDRYMVTADGVGGYNSSCSIPGFDTTCEVPDLACGVRYNFSVTASNGHCDSPPSATFDLETAPCALASITAFAQCHNSSILVLWEPMGGSVGNTVYTAIAEASDRSVLTCNSSASSCDLEGALCGLHYTVIVAASSDSCTSQRSPPYRISMEPCPPQGVVISSSCESHGAHVSWTASPVAETYLVIATGGNGDVRSCNTTANNCSLSALQCGQQYSVSVTASHENCSSMARQNVTFNTVPCQPDGLSVLVQCVNQSALLSWTVRGGVVDYWARAQAEDGIMLYCESTGTSCTITGLECGAQYNFSVQASDGTCNSSFSEPLLAGAAPCPPETMAVTMFPMQNQTQFLRASWTHVNCPNVQYLLEVTGSILGDSQSLFELSSYWTSSSFFELLLPCGSSYSATVRSRNFAGDSAPSAVITGITAPCPPPVVTYSGSNSSATISWNGSVYATMYTVYDISGVVRTRVCSTVQLSCSLANLDYNNLEVTASNTAGESDPTREITVHHLRRRDLSEEEMISEMGLSMPEVRVTVETLNVLVEWSRVKGAAYYTLVVQEQSSRPRHASRSHILTVYGESSIVTDLNPSSTYCLSVSAQTEASKGPYSEPVCVETVAPAVKM
ncbi:fibronectin type III domain-containing protein 7-like [Salvelinus alpinus]